MYYVINFQNRTVEFMNGDLQKCLEWVFDFRNNDYRGIEIAKTSDSVFCVHVMDKA